MHRRLVRVSASRSCFAGFRSLQITGRCAGNLRYGLPYREVEELLADRCRDVDHVTIAAGCSDSPPCFIDAAQPCRHAACRSAEVQ
jgi:IS6 family transposase